MLNSCYTASKAGLLISGVFTLLSMPTSAAPVDMMMVAQAQNDPTTLISLNEYGSFIQAVSGPFSLPGVTSASFQVSRGDSLGDGEFSRVVLPFSSSFESLEFAGMTPYAELTLSHTEQKQSEFWMQSMPMMMMVEHNIKSSSIMAGVGVDFKPTENLIIRPVVHLGWSRIKDNSNPTTPDGQMFRAAVGEGLFIWEIEQLQYGIALEAEHTTNLSNDINILSSLRATQLNIKTSTTSTPGLKDSNQFHSISGNLALDGPTSMSLFDKDVRWLYFMGASKFDNATSDALKFSWLSEAGGGLSLVNNQEDIPFIKALGLTGSVIFGDNEVNGWTMGLKASF
jgi:hypothetical protein